MLLMPLSVTGIVKLVVPHCKGNSRALLEAVKETTFRSLRDPMGLNAVHRSPDGKGFKTLVL